jgi:formylmethanofuran dehydrogenase subunit B
MSYFTCGHCGETQDTVIQAELHKCKINCTHCNEKFDTEAEHQRHKCSLEKLEKDKVKSWMKSIEESAPIPRHCDAINPQHYRNSKAVCTCGHTIECIEIVRHFGFNLGNVIKYIWRCDSKGDRLENLKKAQWYLDDEIKKAMK